MPYSNHRGRDGEYKHIGDIPAPTDGLYSNVLGDFTLTVVDATKTVTTNKAIMDSIVGGTLTAEYLAKGKWRDGGTVEREIPMGMVTITNDGTDYTISFDQLQTDLALATDKLQLWVYGKRTSGGLRSIAIAEQTFDGSTDITLDIDLRGVSFSGFMTLVLITTAKTGANGLADLNVTVQNIVRNVANSAWVLPENSAALTVEDTKNIATVGMAGEWSINKLYETSGDVDKLMMAEGLRFVIDTDTVHADSAGKFVGKVLVR